MTEPRKMPRGRPFERGQSGNPKGRPADFAGFRDACRERSPKALGMIDKALEAEPSPLAIEAAKTVLAYAWGKPPQSVTGEGGQGPVQHEHKAVLPEEFRARLRELAGARPDEP